MYYLIRLFHVKCGAEGARGPITAYGALAVEVGITEMPDVILHCRPVEHRAYGVCCLSHTSVSTQTCVGDHTDSELQVCGIARNPNSTSSSAVQAVIRKMDRLLLRAGCREFVDSPRDLTCGFLYASDFFGVGPHKLLVLFRRKRR
jgi:hypothetical protein